ncbi:MAG: YggT family protein [Candidatus Eisenbacteria bacterium]|nr:YggT family protein [Candidatus Eisenbacteria bacterium]
MFVFGNLMGAVAWLAGLVFDALMLVILLNAVLSWFRLDPSNPILLLLDRVSDFVCNPIRRLFPTVVSGIDLAPLIAMIALMFLRAWIVPTLYGIAARMG